jgi:hypothetical protein
MGSGKYLYPPRRCALTRPSKSWRSACCLHPLWKAARGVPGLGRRAERGRRTGVRLGWWMGGVTSRCARGRRHHGGGGGPQHSFSRREEHPLARGQQHFFGRRQEQLCTRREEYSSGCGGQTRTRTTTPRKIRACVRCPSASPVYLGFHSSSDRQHLCFGLVFILVEHVPRKVDAGHERSRTNTLTGNPVVEHHTVVPAPATPV